MKTRTATLITLILFVISLGYSIWLYPSLPQQVPTHWNARGQINGWGDKNWALFLLPVMMLVMFGLFMALPWMSPKNFKIDTFRGVYNEIIVVIQALFTYLHGVILFATSHAGWDLTRAMFAGMMLFIGLLGNFMGKVRKNFYVGIRTPWTLASDYVWTATHRLGARLMVAAGFVGAFLIIVGLPVMPIFILFMAATLYPVLYSLLLYKRLERNHSL